MTREEIDSTLADMIASETRRSERVAAGSIGGTAITGLGRLAEIIADQERRLRALEPCPGSAEEQAARRRTLATTPRAVVYLQPHFFGDDGKCVACGVQSTSEERRP